MTVVVQRCAEHIWLSYRWPLWQCILLVAEWLDFDQWYLYIVASVGVVYAAVYSIGCYVTWSWPIVFVHLVPVMGNYVIFSTHQGRGWMKAHCFPPSLLTKMVIVHHFPFIILAFSKMWGSKWNRMPMPGLLVLLCKFFLVNDMITYFLIHSSWQCTEVCWQLVWS